MMGGKVVQLQVFLLIRFIRDILHIEEENILAADIVLCHKRIGLLQKSQMMKLLSLIVICGKKFKSVVRNVAESIKNSHGMKRQLLFHEMMDNWL